MNPLYRENASKNLKYLFESLQDDVLDEYNNGKVSRIEMMNVMRWCEKMKKKMVEEVNDRK